MWMNQSLMKWGPEKGSVTAGDGYIKLKEGFVCSHSVFHAVKTGKVQKSWNNMGKCFCGRWENSEIHWLEQT